ncbi:MAG: GNAT family N-acetyltransferase [candidate division KSB1 bacterium]|nr:GNAT family N-acetyltransferase [candidate division KSB1 bacterium]
MKMFKLVSSYDELLKVHMVRAIVFMAGQQCPYHIEIDEYEYSSLHILGELDGEPVAAARLRFVDGFAKFERIAVRDPWRGKGIGHRLVDYMMRVARQHGFEQMKMHAQLYLLDFYKQHGFAPRGDVFKEADIDHMLMILPKSE